MYLCVEFKFNDKSNHTKNNSERRLLDLLVILPYAGYILRYYINYIAIKENMYFTFIKMVC